MKTQRRKQVLVLLLCLLVLAGCTHTNSSSAPPIQLQDSPESTMVPSSSTASTPPPVALVPSSPPASAATQKTVYKEGPIGPGGENHLEIPIGLDEKEIPMFVNYLTIAIDGPLSNLNEMDADTAFRFGRCMIAFYYDTHPDSCSQKIDLVPNSGIIYHIIPMSDFLAFTSTHFGINDISFFQKAIPADDRMVVFQPEEGNILMVPSLEAISSDFKTGFFMVENTTMYLQAESVDLGTLTFRFDISNGMENYRLIDVT